MTQRRRGEESDLEHLDRADHQALYVISDEQEAQHPTEDLGETRRANAVSQPARR